MQRGLSTPSCRGLALCQSMAELEILEALPRQNAADVFLTPQLTG